MKKDGKLNFRIHGFEQQATEDKVQELFTDILVEKMLERYNQLNTTEEGKRVLA